jgi:di/tricarboxylate transporter
MGNKLKQLGLMKKSEKFMVIVFIIVVALWMFGNIFNIDATTVSVLGLVILIGSGVDISALSSGLTHYGIAQGGVYFSEGYVEQKEWCFVGFVMSIVHLTIILLFAEIWWRFIGI